MHRWGKVMQIGFTYIGTIVGAGFASGQEILQFFTRFGWVAVWTILLSTLIFVWLGTKLMLIAREIGAKSYEDLNTYMFGNTTGRWISLFTSLVLFGITTVMLAGAGSIFKENLHLSFQIGVFTTLLLTYFVVIRGVDGILSVNSIVVPLMLIFTLIVVLTTIQSPHAFNFARLPAENSVWLAWLSPFMYAAFNLALAQAVLVPIGASIADKKTIYLGGIAGGIGIGVMLFAGHFALSAQMPEIAQYEIPMSHIIRGLGNLVQTVYALVIFAEIFTTFLANVYGLALQVEQRTRFKQRHILWVLLALCYVVSLFGFKTLLSTLYPLFGLISMVWFGLVMLHRDRAGAGRA